MVIDSSLRSARLEEGNSARDTATVCVPVLEIGSLIRCLALAVSRIIEQAAKTPPLILLLVHADVGKTRTHACSGTSARRDDRESTQ